MSFWSSKLLSFADASSSSPSSSSMVDTPSRTDSSTPAISIEDIAVGSLGVDVEDEDEVAPAVAVEVVAPADAPAVTLSLGGTAASAFKLQQMTADEYRSMSSLPTASAPPSSQPTASAPTAVKRSGCPIGTHGCNGPTAHTDCSSRLYSPFTAHSFQYTLNPYGLLERQSAAAATSTGDHKETEIPTPSAKLDSFNKRATMAQSLIANGNHAIIHAIAHAVRAWDVALPFSYCHSATGLTDESIAALIALLVRRGYRASYVRDVRSILHRSEGYKPIPCVIVVECDAMHVNKTVPVDRVLDY